MNTEFEPKSDVPKQPTVPPMPKVKPPRGNEKLDDINHPDRYSGGQYECIDVMVDVFGVQAVKDFCKLNAFKYLWREEKKGGIEDAKKAIWYLEKFIELGEKNDIKRSD